MPLFGGNERGNDRAQEFAADANGNSVTVDRLTSTKGGLLTDGFLHDKELVDYLRPGEQPHHLFFNLADGVTRNGVTERNDWRNDYRNVLLLTDDRALFFVADSTGDEGEAIPYAIVTDVELQTGGTKPTFRIRTPIAEYTFDVATDAADISEVLTARQYVEQRADELASTGTDPSVHLHGQIEQIPDIWPGSTRRRRTLLESEDFENADPDGDAVDPEELSVPDLAEVLADRPQDVLCDVVAALWEATGWRVRRDDVAEGDAVVEARREAPFAQRHLIRVNADDAGADVVTSLADVAGHDGGHETPVLVAVGEVGHEARERATDLGVKLIDAKQFAALVAEHETYDPLSET